MKRSKIKNLLRKGMVLLLCLCTVTSTVSGFELVKAAAGTARADNAKGVTADVERQADPSTMDTYIDMLNFGENSRYAGRLWSDNTVFAYGQDYTGEGTDAGRTFKDNKLTLSEKLDGVSGEVTADADFLHVFSTLGSSQQVVENVSTPIDLVIVVDLSGTMVRNEMEADTGTINKNNMVEVEFVNTKGEVASSPWRTGDLKVSNTVAGTDGDVNKDFHFTVTLSDKIVNGQYGDMTFKAGTAEITLKHGESATATGLPASITYEVTETEADQDGYTTKASGNTGTILEKGMAEALFVNTKYEVPPKVLTGVLKVSKTVAGNDGDVNKDFHFTVTLSDKTVDGQYGDMTFTAGTAELTLKHGESATATGLPAGITYKVVETEADQDGYTTTVKAKGSEIERSRLGITLNAINNAIDQLMSLNETNRVTVIGYGLTAATIMELGHYKPDDDGTYLKAEDLRVDSSTQEGYATVHLKAKKETELGNEKSYVDVEKKVDNHNTVSSGTAEDKQRLNDLVSGGGSLVGSYTDMQSGIYQGFNELYQNVKTVDDVTYKYKSKLTGNTKTLPRVPVAFVMTDGGSNYALKENSTSDPTGDEWFKVPVATEISGLYGNYEKYYDTGENEGGGAVILDILMTTSYMKSKIQNKYTELLQEASLLKDDEAADFKIHTFSVDTPGKDNIDKNYAEYQLPRVYVGLDPKDFFRENPEKVEGIDTDPQKDWKHQTGDQFLKKDRLKEVKEGYDAWEKWKNGNDPVKLRAYKFGYKDIPFNQLPDSEKEVSKKDIIDNIMYNDSFADVSAVDLNGLYSDIITRESIFVPVSGDNDLGVNDSVTYKDPVGKHMEIKDVKALTLFGKKYDIATTAMYNYSFVYAHRQNGADAIGSFKDGWYHFNADGEWLGDVNYGDSDWKTGLTDPDCFNDGTKGDSPTWGEQEDGSYWAYFVNSNTAIQFLPTVANDLNLKDLQTQEPEKYNKLVNTTYTFYRINETKENREALQMNPAYGTSVPKDVTYDPVNQTHLQKPGVYALADLRLWDEDVSGYTGDMADNGTMMSNDYDRAMCVNVPANMLPLRTVTVDADKEDPTKRVYITNLNRDAKTYKEESTYSDPYWASFPMRIFYTVGIESSVLTSDGSIDLGNGISNEYINNNKVKDDNWAKARNISNIGSVEFFSNWYNAKNRYSDYVINNTDYSYGDPVVTFSPSTDNRYYAFEKALPLYKAAYVYNGSEWKKVEIKNSGADAQEGSYTPTEFGGKLLSDDLDATGEGDIADKLGDVSPEKGDVVFLKSDMLSNVDKADPDPFSSDAYYFMAIEYYRDAEGEAIPVQYAVTRKGSEFGSGYKVSGISNGDMLCWYDTSGNSEDIYPYLSYTETNDKSRGREYIGAELDPDTGWYKDKDAAAKELPDAKPDQSTGSSIYEKGTWVVAAKPGGLRVGDLAQAVQEKGGGQGYTEYKQYAIDRFGDNGDGEPNVSVGYYEGNTTRTANNYYMPTISANTSIIDNNVVVNCYLGNNGRLVVGNTQLLLTKILAPGVTGEMPADTGKEYNYQVYISGRAGDYNPVRVRYNEATGTWQEQIHYIDVNVNDNGYLLDVGGSLATYPQGDQQYNVYIGKHEQADIGSDSKAVRVYHNQYCELIDANKHAVSKELVKVKCATSGGNESWAEGGTVPADFIGKRDYYIKGVKLVPVDKGAPAETEGVDGVTTPEATDTDSGKESLFYVATLDQTGDSGNVEVRSDYSTTSDYLTQTVNFGSDANGEALTEEDLYVTDKSKYDRGDTTPWNHIAEVKLMSGWGLLFHTMDTGTAYVMAEKLTKEDVDEGYDFQSVTHVTQDETYVYPSSDKKFINTGYVYAVSGDTGAKREEGNYVNTWSSNKTETHINGDAIAANEPGDNTYPGVQEGDSITYKIKWANTTDKPARIVIIDQLDAGVNYDSATPDANAKYCDTPKDANDHLKQIYADKGDDVPQLDSGHAVIWDLGEQGSGEKGEVTLTVKVNDKAMEWWDYDRDGVADEPFDGSSAEDPDFTVHNRATVRVADNSYNTNVIQNPVSKPEKTETQIKHADEGLGTENVTEDKIKPNEDGKLHAPVVFAGDEITYDITWKNYKNKEATVTLSDPLDKNVELVSAEFDPANTNPKDGAKPAQSKLTGGQTATENKAEGYDTEKHVIEYDKENHEVTWNLGTQPAGANGKVTLKVKVLDTATPVGYVDNTAYVTVNGDPKQKTKTIENPTPNVKKTEISPGRGRSVMPEDEIVYEVTWKNYHEQQADVVVNDKLDPGVDFTEASFDNVTLKGDAQAKGKITANSEDGNIGIEYDKDTHTVTWTLKDRPANAEGKVKLTVTVNNDADEYWSYDTPEAKPDVNRDDDRVLNKASVKVANDPGVFTTIIDNPTGPRKAETDINGKDVTNDVIWDHETGIYNGPEVNAGDSIKYNIIWHNASEENADIVITDTLDTGVDYVSSDSGGSYDKSNRTVTWNLGTKAPREHGVVSLTVKVNKDAIEPGQIENDATVKVGNKPYQTHNVLNPVGKSGDLKVSKTVAGTGGDVNKDFHFTVTLSDDALNGQYGDMTFTAGTAEITLKHGESATATGLPSGITYDVTETEADQDGYTTEATGNTGTIPEDTMAEAEFVNTRDEVVPPPEVLTGDLKVSKTVAGDDGDVNKDFHFTVTLSDDTVNGQYGDMTFTAGTAELTLKHGESATATGLPAGITYGVVETEADQDGYTTEATGNTGTIPENGMAEAEFVNTKDNAPGDLKVSKTVAGDDGDVNKDFHFTVTLSDETVDGQYGDMTFTAGTAEITLKHGESATATGLPSGITYEVVETEADQDGYTTEATGNTGTIPGNGMAEAEFVNTKDTAPGDLKVSKTVAGTDGDVNKDFHFTVTLSDETVDGQYGDMTFTAGTAEITLKHGESATATGLPSGITYGVVETEADQDGYTTEATGNTGTIPGNGMAEAEFVNTKDKAPGDLKVSKTVAGTDGDVNKDFHFTVTLSDETVDGQYGDMTFTAGTAELTLKHGESATATGLPSGITYEVVETEADQDGYTTEATGDKGDIPENGMAEAEFVNTRDNVTGDLKVSKTVAGTGGDVNKDFHFTVTLNDETVDGQYGDMTFTAGTAEITLKHGESATATGLTAGITYEVVETEADQDGYTTEATGDTGDIPENGMAEAEFVNTRDEVAPPPEDDNTVDDPGNEPDVSTVVREPKTGDVTGDILPWLIIFIVSITILVILLVMLWRRKA